jgi:hypothetical protein
MTFSLEQHIEELRAEYIAVLDHAEHGEIAAEIAAAEAKHAEEEAAFETLISAEPPIERGFASIAAVDVSRTALTFSLFTDVREGKWHVEHFFQEGHGPRLTKSSFRRGSSLATMSM